MKKKFTAMAALAVLLVCALAGAALAEETPDTPDATLETEVSIGFEGAVYFVEMESGGMNIDFGTHMIPPRGANITLSASDSDHTLRVCDRRATPGNWSVTSIMTQMISGSDSFITQINHNNPTFSTGLTPNFYETSTTAITNATNRKFMDAEANLEAGEYDLTTTVGNTRLYVSASELPKIKALEYSATVTWTLVLTP